MWKKPENNEVERDKTQTPQAPPVARKEPRKTSERAIIGPSITIQGDVTGEEDLLIQGQIEGKVDLKQYSVAIGDNGRVKADIHGRTVTVEGTVEGSLYGDEQVVVRQSGRVHGNIIAPRVTLEDGATFKGSIDMEIRPQAQPARGPTPVPTPVTGASQKPSGEQSSGSREQNRAAKAGG
jgi:cytoskeletal protein CcmA (bactofilin family)